MPLQDLLLHLMAYAKIDCIMISEPDEWLRSYRYDKKWVEDGHFIEINNGSGDHFYVLFSQDGCIIKGFDHESELSPYGDLPKHLIHPNNYYKDTPERLLSLLDDPALEKDMLTFCAWQAPGDQQWRYGKIEFPESEYNDSTVAEWNDGIDAFLAYACDLEGYQQWFEENYEGWYKAEPDIELDRVVLQDIFDGKPITAEMIKCLNPERDVDAVLKELERF
jgi:hypothetical protein